MGSNGRWPAWTFEQWAHAAHHRHVDESVLIHNFLKYLRKIRKSVPRWWRQWYVPPRWLLERFGVASAEHVNNVVTKSMDASELLNRGVLLAPF